jgi:outer membrane protein assembly factor BamA
VSELRAGIERVKQLYRTAGYPDVIVEPVPEVDNASRRINFALRITEGSSEQALNASAASYGVAQANSVVGRIIMEGNRRVSREKLLMLIHTHAGDTYNDTTLQRDFKALWGTKDFIGIRLEVQDDPNRANTKNVIFHFIERPAL